MIALLAAASLAATTIDPQAKAILDAARAAAGGAAIQALGPYELDEDATWGRLSGTASFVCDPKTGTWMRRESIGRLVDADGFDGSQVWTQDSTGDSWPVVDPYQTYAAFRSSYFCSFAYWFPERMPAVTIRKAPQILGDSDAYDTVEVGVRDLDSIDLSFDKKSHLLAKVVSESPATTETTETDYGDYRDVGGVMIAFARSTNSVFSHGNTYYVHVRRVSLDPSVVAQIVFKPKHPADATIASSSRPVPIEITEGRVFVELRIDGKGPFRFALDTAQTDHITSALAAKLGLTDESGARIQASPAKPTQYFTDAKTVRLGPVELRNQPFVVDPPQWSVLLGDHVDGMLGFEFLRRVDATIDFVDKQLVLREPRTYVAPPGSSTVPFVFDGVLPRIRASVDGKPGAFDVNTESPAALVATFLWTYHNEHAVGFANLKDPGYEFFFGRRLEQVIGSIRRGDISIGGRDIPGAVIVNEAQPGNGPEDVTLDGDIGNALLDRFTVTFDYQNQKLWLTPTPRSADPEPFDRSGIILWLWPDTDVEIVKGSPAAQAGLHTRDELLTIDGKAASKWSLDALTRLLRSMGTKVTIEYRAAGKKKTTAVRTVVIPLKDYL